VNRCLSLEDVEGTFQPVCSGVENIGFI